MSIDYTMTIAAFFVAIVVGLTGMGGGALMTPVLVFFFNVPPLAAVSSDLVAAAVMKPVGSLVHLRRGTVNLELVKFLCIGSVPAAFLGVFVARLLGRGSSVETVVQYSLGIALLLASFGLVAKAYLKLLERARKRHAPELKDWNERPVVTIKPWQTVLVGFIGGLVVGMTSVGSGSLIIVALILLYPALKAGQLVGTDLVQAVPLVASAALAHILFGDFQLSITTSLLLGSIPGVYLGAKLSAYAPGGIVRRALAVVLLASALKLLGVSTTATVLILLAVILVAPPLWMITRKRHGFPAWGSAKDVESIVITAD